MVSYRYGYGIVVANGCFRQYPTRLSFFDSVGDYKEQTLSQVPNITMMNTEMKDKDRYHYRMIVLQMVYP